MVKNSISTTSGSSMQFISTKVHGMMDYPTAATVACLPLLGSGGGTETWLPVMLGGTSILSSLMTDYEMGVVPVISMENHIRLDIASGALLALSPFIFGFYKKGISSWLPHVALGIMEICTALMTDPNSSRAKEDPYHGRSLQADPGERVRIRRQSQSVS